MDARMKSRVPYHLHGSLMKEVPGAAVPLRGAGHDSSVKEPFCAFQVQAPGTGAALENIENRQKHDCDQYSFVSQCGAVFCQCSGNQLQALTLGSKIVVEWCFERESWACSRHR